MLKTCSDKILLQIDINSYVIIYICSQLCDRFRKLLTDINIDIADSLVLVGTVSSIN